MLEKKLQSPIWQRTNGWDISLCFLLHRIGLLGRTPINPNTLSCHGPSSSPPVIFSSPNRAYGAPPRHDISKNNLDVRYPREVVRHSIDWKYNRSQEKSPWKDTQRLINACIRLYCITYPLYRLAPYWSRPHRILLTTRIRLSLGWLRKSKEKSEK